MQRNTHALLNHATRILGNLNNVTRNDPMAMEPRWYLNTVHHEPKTNVNGPYLSLFPLQSRIKI
jgi:hypothetical protein